MASRTVDSLLVRYGLKEVDVGEQQARLKEVEEEEEEKGGRRRRKKMIKGEPGVEDEEEEVVGGGVGEAEGMNGHPKAPGEEEEEEEEVALYGEAIQVEAALVHGAGTDDHDQVRPTYPPTHPPTHPPLSLHSTTNPSFSHPPYS